MTQDPLPSWRATPTRAAIEAFIRSVTEGPDAVPLEERVAVFDNDGTLWTEKPMPTQLHYIVERWREAVDADPSLAEVEPYRSAATGDYAWLGNALAKHTAGDDTDLRTMIGALTHLTDGMSVADYEASVTRFADEAQHPLLHRPYSHVIYQPMVELLRFLEEHGFTCYIVSGGDRDFMRPITQRVYLIPPERVVGSAVGLSYDASTAEVRYAASFAFFDDGPEKPVRIWSRIGRRPLFAAGNSDGDAEMLDYARGGGHPGFALLVHHDDTERGDVPYDAGATSVLSEAGERGYTVVSVERDWETVFPAYPANAGTA